MYFRYSYWLTKERSIIKNRHSENSDRMARVGNKYIGAWYAHEKTPYISNMGDVVRDWYGKRLIWRGGGRWEIDTHECTDPGFLAHFSKGHRLGGPKNRRL